MKNLALSCCLLVFAACGSELEPAPAAVARGTSPLEAHFAEAARAYQVPEGVLKSIAWVETRVSALPLESGSGGFGVMQLARRGDWDTLGDAARLTGADEPRLKLDARANILGAAAVLRQLFDRLAREDASLDANAPGDWYRAVSLYAGFDSATAAADYAADVFLRLEAGFEVKGREGTVVQAPLATGWRRHAPEQSVRRDAVIDYPTARWVTSPNFSSGRSTYEFVVIHTMQGSYSGAISWFQNTASQVSAHYCVRSSDGEITQMVEHRNTAWHAQCYNGRSIGIEHEGYVQDPGRWYTDAMYNESAKLTRWIADRHGISKDRTHIIGHVEVAPNCNTGGHTDPGSGWNWTKYMSLVLNQGPTPTTGVFIGAIYTGGSTSNRVAGAVVTVAGQSVTTGADGIYQFNLAPGSYTASVTKAGFTSASVTRTVSSGAQIWGLMEINPAAATGTLRGKVFVYDAANPSDMSQLISDATVTVNGASKQTDAQGEYVFDLAPGTYTVSVTKAGYAPAQLSRTVTASTVTTGNVGLTSSSTPDVQPPQVAIVAPAPGSAVDLAAVEVKGTASDDRGAIATVQLMLNGGATQDVAVTNGAFSASVLLKPGTNSLAVSAKDAAGNPGNTISLVTFNAGVGGFVHVQGDDSARVAGASVELFQPGSGTKVSATTTDSNGAYSLPVMSVPADYLVVVRAQGYLTFTETVTVPEDRKLAFNPALVAGQDQPGEASITFMEPMDGATVMTDSVTVYGTVKGFEVVGVKVNGVAAELLGAGGFTASVPLSEGENTVEAVASGVAGQSVSGRLSVTRKAAGNQLAPTAVKGGCSVGAGLEVFALLGLLPLLRRRR